MNPSSIQGESKPHVYAVWFERRDREGIAAAMNSFAERPAVVHAFVQAQLSYELLKAVEAQNQRLEQLIELAAASNKASQEWREEGRAGLETFQQTLSSLNLVAHQDKPEVPDLALPEFLEASTDWLPPVEEGEEPASNLPAQTSPTEPTLTALFDVLDNPTGSENNAG